MLVTNCSFITIIRENDIVINPYDMNLILTTVLAHPSIRMVESLTPLCLPGIADDGFLYLTVRYITPNIGVIFAAISPDSFFPCLAKAHIIAQELQSQGLLPELTKAIQQNYLMNSPIVAPGT